MSDSHTLIDLLNRQLERRRYLNRDDVRRSRQATTPKPQHISLTFAEAEAIVAALQRQDATAFDDKDAAIITEALNDKLDEIVSYKDLTTDDFDHVAYDRVLAVCLKLKAVEAVKS
jgi:hypothetical protein